MKVYVRSSMAQASHQSLESVFLFFLFFRRSCFKQACIIIASCSWVMGFSVGSSRGKAIPALVNAGYFGGGEAAVEPPQSMLMKHSTGDLECALMKGGGGKNSTKKKRERERERETKGEPSMNPNT